MRKKICFVTTVSITVKSFLIDFAHYLTQKRDYDVTFICNTDESLYSFTNEHIHYIPISMKRGIGFDGLSVISNLKKIFKEQHPKALAFIKSVSEGDLREGSVIEVKVTTPEGKESVSNIKLTKDDIETFNNTKTK